MTQPADSDPDPLEQSFDHRPEVSDDILPIARRAQAGDEQALNELFTRYQEPLRRIVRVRLGTRIRQAGVLDSMDIVQETFANAHRKLPEFEIRHERSVIAWLARIAEYQIHDAHDYVSAKKRDAGRVARLDELLGGDSFDPEADQTRPEGHAARNELREIVDECVADLKDDYREVILLRDYAQADWNTITEQIGAKNVKAAQATHYRARGALAVKLARRLPDDPALEV